MDADNDIEKFQHLARADRQAVTDLLKQASDMVTHRAKPGQALRAASAKLVKHGLTNTNELLWCAALQRPGNPTERVRFLGDTLQTADTVLYQAHRERKFAEVKTAEAGIKLSATIAQHRFFSHYTNMTFDDLTEVGQTMASWLRTLTPHERDLLTEYCRTSQRQFLPPPAATAIPGDTDTSPVVRNLLGALLVKTEHGTEVTRHVATAIESCRHLCRREDQVKTRE